MQVEQLSEMKKKHLKAIKKQDQDIRAKKAVGIWKRRTWKSLSRKGSGAVTPVTEPVTRAGSEDEEEDEGDDEGEEEEGTDEYGEIKMGPIRRRSEGVAVDVCTTFPFKIPKTLTMQQDANHAITHHSFLLPNLLRPQTHHHPAAR